jgi:peroxiredoxin Q/BCP
MAKILIIGGLVIVLVGIMSTYLTHSASNWKTRVIAYGNSEGAKAPDFFLPSSTGSRISLSDYEGKKNVVLYFYPKDMTPGCTTEACSFRDLKDRFEAAGAVILGVSNDDLDSHAKFTAAEHLNFPLLSDANAVVCKDYGVYKPLTYKGATFMGIERTTFVIDKHGIIRKVYPKVAVDKHADEVLNFVRTLR